MKKLLLLFVMMLLLVTNAFAVEVEIDGLWYDVVAMSKIKEAKVIQYKNNKYSGDIVIPETVEYEGVTCSVTSIEQKAFYDCKGLTSVVIGNNVITIGEKAFYYCKGLTSVTIGNSVTSIRGQAFDDCTALTSIYISDLAAWCGIDGGLDLCRYAKHLFINGEDIKQIRNLVIPNSVTRIGSYAFYGFRNLISVTIPNSVASIGAGAFEDCRSLTSVHISDIATWCNIQFYSNPLYYAHHLFLNGEEIKDLVIPNSVTSINSSAFSGCTGLTSITIPNSVTSIGSSAFYGCSGLTSVTIPNSVTSIGDWAFKECSSLTSVTIPNSVTSIGSSAFENCI